MANLTASEIATVARNAGFPESEIDTAVAVAFAESSGNPKARNASGATGLWQILVKAHPDLAAKYDLTDADQNGKAAYAVWKAAGNKWTPWSTYNSGSYKRYLGMADDGTAPLNPDTHPANTGNPGLLNGGTIQQALGFVGTEAFWTRFGIGVLGAALIIAGVIIVFRKPAMSLATSVATKGLVNLPKE